VRRRDMSKALLGVTAGSALLSQPAQAQSSCVAPCFAQTAAEIAAGVTPSNLQHPTLDVRRYGAVLDGAADDTQALGRAIAVAAQLGGGEIAIPQGILRLTAPLLLRCE